jgi:hypothetical protein
MGELGLTFLLFFATCISFKKKKRAETLDGKFCAMDLKYKT